MTAIRSKPGYARFAIREAFGYHIAVYQQGVIPAVYRASGGAHSFTESQLYGSGLTRGTLESFAVTAIAEAMAQRKIIGPIHEDPDLMNWADAYMNKFSPEEQDNYPYIDEHREATLIFRERAGHLFGLAFCRIHQPSGDNTTEWTMFNPVNGIQTATIETVTGSTAIPTNDPRLPELVRQFENYYEHKLVMRFQLRKAYK